jgi:hypothetical protein
MFAPELVREFAERLFPEQFEADRVAALLGALKWLESAMGEPSAVAAIELTDSQRIVKRLREHISQKGEGEEIAVAKALAMKRSSVQAWLRGIYLPTQQNCARLEQWLEKKQDWYSRPSAPNAGPSELFPPAGGPTISALEQSVPGSSIPDRSA